MKKIIMQAIGMEWFLYGLTLTFLRQFVLALTGKPSINGFVALVGMVGCFGLSQTCRAIKKKWRRRFRKSNNIKA